MTDRSADKPRDGREVHGDFIYVSKISNYFMKYLFKEILTLQKNRFFERIHAKFFDIGQRSTCPVTNDNQVKVTRPVIR